jgi:hypothetical protein
MDSFLPNCVGGISFNLVYRSVKCLFFFFFNNMLDAQVFNKIYFNFVPTIKKTFASHMFKRYMLIL